jgi:hypothetical protein
LLNTAPTVAASVQRMTADRKDQTMTRPEWGTEEWRQQAILEEHMAGHITQYVGLRGDYVLLSRQLLNIIDNHQDRMDRLEEEAENA